MTGSTDYGALPHCDRDRAPLLASSDGRSSLRQQLKIQGVIPVAISLCLLVFMCGIEATIVAASGTVIAMDLKNSTLGPYLGTSFLLAATISGPILARMSDVVGRTRVVILSGVLFVIGIVLCAVSQTMVQLLLSRAVSGVGGGGINILCSILLSENVPLNSRAFWYAIGKVVSGIAMAVGGPVGGLVADHLSWRWAFALQVPFCAGVIFVTALQLPWKRSYPSDATILHTILNVDAIGGILLAAVVAPVLFCASTVSSVQPTEHPFQSILLTVAISAFSASLLYAWETRHSLPIIDFGCLEKWSICSLCLMNMASTLAYSTALYAMPAYFVVVRGRTATQASLLFVPAAALSAIVSLWVGYQVAKKGQCQLFTNVGMLLVVLGGWTTLQAFRTESEARQNILACISISTCAMGTQVISAVSMVAMLRACKEEDIASATSLLALSKSIGNSVGSASAVVLVHGYLYIALNGKDAIKEVPEALDIILNVAGDIPKLPAAVQELAYKYWFESFVFESITSAVLVTVLLLVVAAKP